MSRIIIETPDGVEKIGTPGSIVPEIKGGHLIIRIKDGWFDKGIAAGYAPGSWKSFRPDLGEEDR